MVNTAILVSGGGTNLQAILDSLHFGEIKNCKIVEVISSSPDAYALVRAENAGVPHHVIDIKQYTNRFVYTDAVIDRLRAVEAELVVLSGFMFVLSPRLTDLFKNRVINVHPALIPSFCGSGYYGLHVHKSVLEYGVKVTGATVHFATAQTDAGPIILQKAVDVHEDDTPETLQRRVMEEAEWIILPRAISLFCEGRLVVEGRNVRILGEEPKWIL